MIPTSRISVLRPSWLLGFLSVTVATAAGMLVSAGPASAQSQLDVLHAFASQGAAVNPGFSLVQATDGNFYGTTGAGTFAGTAFRMTPSGTVTVLHVFAGGTDGADPAGSVIQATDGNFYGTTFHGGAADFGTVFRMTPGGTVTILHAFTGGSTDGGYPAAGLIQGADGNFYGTTGTTDADYGTVFRMTPAGTVTVLHAFTGGVSPASSLIQATDGNFYGTTQSTIYQVTPGGTFTAFALIGVDYLAGSLIQATDGNFYGTAASSGTGGAGAVFRMTPSGSVTVLHTFAGGTDGASPASGLIQATDGNFYGTTSQGGASNNGTVFQMTPSGAVTILHAFTNVPDGSRPFASLIQAADGNFYGTTYQGGTLNFGTVFKITSSATYSVLHVFAGSVDGADPTTALIQATDGNFYGTTAGGGASNDGTVFQMTPSGTVTILHTFTGGTTDGASPRAALIQGTDGNLYGTTSQGGTANDGTLFRMTASGTLTVLHTFTGGTTDGASPWAPLIQATDGNFYGTTVNGGTANSGTVFRMTPSGTVAIVHAFMGGTTDGAFPSALIQAIDGSFYGTTGGGGTADAGTIFRMTPSGTVTVLYAFGAGTLDPSPLIQSNDGNFYGTIAYRPTILIVEQGAAFKMTPSGAFTILHTFMSGNDGGSPLAALIQATDGNFYGTSYFGGTSGAGTVFRMTPSGTVTVLHSFGFAGLGDGAYPVGALIQATDRSLYGTTSFGGAGSGVAFRLRLLPKPDGDFDGDGKSDITIFRPSSNTWYVLRSSTGYTTFSSYVWGVAGDVPVRGDFDGDGKADVAIYRPSTGAWYILLSSTGYTTYVSYLWGAAGDIPEPGDYDGDGRTDIAAYRPSTGTWYILLSSTGNSTYTSHAWGLTGDVPVQGDYDGDGKTDIAVYRPSNGWWYALQSSTNDTTYLSFQWGLGGDVPVAADYDGDGKVDPAVYRPSNGGWYFLRSSTSYTTYGAYLWGLEGDIPVPGDFDGDGKEDIAVYRPSSGDWYILWSSTNYMTYGAYQWGLAGDTPLAPTGGTASAKGQFWAADRQFSAP
jgi:uncharacterized repeat protein (TIGR03803 family)